jgi:hypothetical protein
MIGVTLKHAATRKQPWGVIVQVTIGDDRIRTAKFYATEAAARVGLAHAETEVQRLRDRHAAKTSPTPAPESLPRGDLARPENQTKAVDPLQLRNRVSATHKPDHRRDPISRRRR